MNSLPAQLVESEEFLNLTDAQRAGLTARLHYFREIASKIPHDTTTDKGIFLENIDDVELDIFSILSDPGGVDRSVSFYRIHSSWTFECHPRKMLDGVGKEALGFLSIAVPGAAASYAEARAWSSLWASKLDGLLDGLQTAPSLESAIGHLIAIDAFASLFLTFAAVVRFNSGLNSQ
jgi:hypothetical protein